MKKRPSPKTLRREAKAEKLMANERAAAIARRTREVREQHREQAERRREAMRGD